MLTIPLLLAFAAVVCTFIYLFVETRVPMIIGLTCQDLALGLGFGWDGKMLIVHLLLWFSVALTIVTETLSRRRRG
jgi:hypothetical protein